LDKNNPKKLFYISSAANFFLKEKKAAKKTCASRLKKRQKNSGTCYAPKFFSHFLFYGFCRQGISDIEIIITEKQI